MSLHNNGALTKTNTNHPVHENKFNTYLGIGILFRYAPISSDDPQEGILTVILNVIFSACFTEYIQFKPKYCP